MKSTILKGLICASFIILAVGCGKSGGKGGSSQDPYALNPIYGNQQQQNEALKAELANWYNAAEPSYLRHYQIITNNISYTSGGSACTGEIKKFLGIEWCITKYGGGSNSIYPRYIVTQNYGFITPMYCEADTNNYCKPDSWKSYPGKKANAKLLEALNGRNNSLYLVSISKVGSLYYIAYATNPVDQRPSVEFVIDTSVHSMYNPMKTTDFASSSPSIELIQFI